MRSERELPLKPGKWCEQFLTFKPIISDNLKIHCFKSIKKKSPVNTIVHIIMDWSDIFSLKFAYKSIGPYFLKLRKMFDQGISKWI